MCKAALANLTLAFVFIVGCSSSNPPPAGGGTGGAGTASGGAAGGSPGSGGGASATGGAPATDAGGSDVAAPDSGGGGAPVDAGGTTTCGTMQPDLTAITTGVEGLAIGPDGTIYFSQQNTHSVGRVRPGMAAEKTWAMLPVGCNTIWGIAVDPKNHVLFVGSPATGTVYKVTIADTPVVTPLMTKAGLKPNGFTLGPDGACYYTDQQGMGDVHRITVDGTDTTVNMTPLLSPNGLAFGPDGQLYVLQYGAGSIVKFAVTAGMEQAASRATFVMNGLNADDGIAFDKTGNLYIGFGRGLSKVSADGKMITNIPPYTGNSANVEFGTGALSCKDIYFVNGAKILRYTNDTEGAVVPWHVP